MITFTLIASLNVELYGESWVLDYGLTYEACRAALIDFTHSNIFANGVILTCEKES